MDVLCFLSCVSVTVVIVAVVDFNRSSALGASNCAFSSVIIACGLEGKMYWMIIVWLISVTVARQC
jgi:hypothetical protein